MCTVYILYKVMKIDQLVSQSRDIISSTNYRAKNTVMMAKNPRVDSSFAPSQWETALLCNDVSHWLGASLESSLWVNITPFDKSGIILWMCLDNERRRWIVTSTLIGWAHTQNDPCKFVLQVLTSMDQIHLNDFMKQKISQYVPPVLNTKMTQ